MSPAVVEKKYPWVLLADRVRLFLQRNKMEAGWEDRMATCVTTQIHAR